MDRESINFEILRIAKEIVINEYVDRRAHVHNQWLVESDFLWKSQRLRLAYPPIPPYPTEQEVVERAKTLLAFLNSPQGMPGPVTTVNPPDVVEDVVPVKAIPAEVPVDEVIEDVETVAEAAAEASPVADAPAPVTEANEQQVKTFPSILKNFWNRDDKK